MRWCMMAKMCPMQGCKEKEGMCIHEKMMLVLLIVAVVVVVFLI